MLFAVLAGTFWSQNHLSKKQVAQMARAKRHYLRGHVWHITHRCHKKEFLLKFVKDRQRWLYWLFQAKKRYRKWIEVALKESELTRQSKWTQSIAVGDKSFLEHIKERLGIRAKGRRIKKNGDTYQLREPVAAYGWLDERTTDNRIYWNISN